jgi:hypothetical protein
MRPTKIGAPLVYNLILGRGPPAGVIAGSCAEAHEGPAAQDQLPLSPGRTARYTASGCERKSAASDWARLVKRPRGFDKMIVAERIRFAHARQFEPGALIS